MIIDLADAERIENLFFENFSETMQLKEVVLGINSALNKDDIKTAVNDDNVQIIETRAAFRRFEVVRQLRKR